MILVKGIVHTKIVIRSSFTQPYVVPNLCDFLPSVEIKRKILKNVSNQTVAIDFHGGNNISQWQLSNVWYPKFVLVQQKRNYTGLEQYKVE